MKLLGHIKRIAIYSGKLINSIFRKATKGTSSAFKTVAVAITGAVTAVLVTAILIMLTLVSVPVAAFTTTTEVSKTDTEETSQSKETDKTKNEGGSDETTAKKDS